MPHETRRAARRAAPQTSSPDAPDGTDSGSEEVSAPVGRRRRRGRAIWITVGVIALVLVGAAAWVGFKALTVKNELEAAQRLIGTSGDSGASAADRLRDIGAHATAASDAAGDPLWHLAEYVPIAGDNLRAVRVASESIAMLADDIGVPAVAAMNDGTGGAPLGRILTVLEEKGPAVAEMASTVGDAASSRWLIGPVRTGIDQVDDVMRAAGPALSAAPALLGADEVKNYLLVFQNNAEVVPLGGSAASQTLVSADNGAISIVAQASSTDFRNGRAVDVPVDQSAIDLYGNYLLDHVNTTPSRPDFPTAARLLSAFWQRDIRSDQIDGVVSVDPIALGRILEATGPITVGDIEITSKNATQVLLKDVYAKWDPSKDKSAGRASDAFFATVADTVFSKISSGDFDVKDMVWAVSTSIANGDILLWSEDASLAPLIQGQRVAGVLPGDNAAQTTMGVYFRDTSASKIDYYMDSAISIGRTCSADRSTFTADTTLHLNLTQEQADALPGYVQSGTWGSEQFRTEVFVYGPPGTSFESATVDGRDVAPMRTDVNDLGRPVASFQTLLRPGETAKVSAVFTGTGDFGPLELQSTPMVRTTDKTVTDGCG